jgi:hypothetical protein
MQRFNAIHCAALLLTLGLTLPLAAAEPGANRDRASAGNTAPAVASTSALPKNADVSGTKKYGGVKFWLTCGGGGCGYGGYGYSQPVYQMPVYRAPVYSAPVYSAPVYAAPAATAPAAAPAPALPNAVIELSNSEDDTVAYTLNGERFDMQPRYSQKLTTRPSWVIEFDRGGSFGTASYTLTQGKYKFVATDHGWDVHQDTGRPAAPSPVANYADNANSR